MALVGGIQARYLNLTNSDADVVAAHTGGDEVWYRHTLDLHSILSGGHAGSPTTGINYSQGGYDSVITHCAGITRAKNLGCITFSPPWMIPSADSATQNSGHKIPDAAFLDDWAAGAAAVAAHFEAYLDAIEIFNEPQHNDFNQNPTMATLRPFMRKAILAIRAAAPSLKIMCGGCSSDRTKASERSTKLDAGSRYPAASGGDVSIAPAPYLDGLYNDPTATPPITNGIDAGTTPGTAFVDAIAIHGYTGNVDPRTNGFESPLYHSFFDQQDIGSPAIFGSGAGSGFNYYDDIVRVRDPGKKIWMTEGGFYGGFTTLDINTAASYAEIAWSMWADQQAAGKAGPYFLFELKNNAKTNNDGTLVSSNKEDYLGNYVWHTDGSFTAKPQLAVWTAITTPSVVVTPPPPPPPPGGTLWNAQNQTLTWGQLFGPPGTDQAWGNFGALLITPPPDPPPPTDPPPDPTNPPPPATTGDIGWAASLDGITLGLAPYDWQPGGPNFLGWDSLSTSRADSPSGDGSVATGADRFEERDIDLPIQLVLDGQVDALTAYQALAAVWQPSTADTDAVDMLEMSTPMGRRQFFGRPERLSPAMESVLQGVLTCTARFVALDPNAYSDPKTVKGSATAGATSGRPFPFGFPFSWGGSNHGGVTIQNDGNRPTRRAVIIITAGSGGVNNPRLELLTTGESLIFTIALLEGQTLWIDLLEQTVLLNNTELRTGKLQFPESKWPTFPPGPSEMRFDGTGAADVTVTYQSAYAL